MCLNRRGSLNVDYTVVTTNDSSAPTEVVRGNTDLLSGQDTITYDNQTTPVSGVLLVTSSGNNGRIRVIQDSVQGNENRSQLSL